MQKPITTCLLLLLFFSNCFAQFNDSTHYRLRYLATGSLNQTKAAKAYLFNNGTLFNISQPKTVFSASANWTYGQQNNVLTNNDFIALANLDFHKKNTRLYYWALSNYQTSYSLKTAYKIQAGGGFGYSIVDSPRTYIGISDGFLYEANNLIDPDLGQDVYSTVRNSFRLRYKFIIKKVLTLNGTDFVQPSLLSVSDYILNFNNDLSLQLRKWLNLTTALNYNRINRTKRDNLLLTFGISIDKYF